MKVSKITKKEVSDFLRLDDSSDVLITPIMDAAKAYIRTYTGLSDAEIDEHDDFYIAFLVLCQDMYDNRSFSVANSSANKVVETILGSHCVNYL